MLHTQNTELNLHDACHAICRQGIPLSAMR